MQSPIEKLQMSLCKEINSGVLEQTRIDAI